MFVLALDVNPELQMWGLTRDGTLGGGPRRLAGAVFYLYKILHHRGRPRLQLTAVFNPRFARVSPGYPERGMRIDLSVLWCYRSRPFTLWGGWRYVGTTSIDRRDG
jgi:hypothetical protein